MPERAAVIAQLSRVLAELYADRGSAERMAHSAGLDVTRLAFDGRALNTWHAIVQEAQFQGQLEVLLELASTEYPKYEPLRQAMQAYRALAAAPPVPTLTAASPGTAPEPGRVFLSYSRVDRDYVAGLAAELERRGFIVWYDDRIDLGHRWWRTIERQIEACAAMVVVMSPEARESEWVEREIMLAQQERKPILPLLLRGKGLSLLINQQYADVRNGQLPPQAFYTRLRRAVPPLQGDVPVADEPATPAGGAPPSSSISPITSRPDAISPSTVTPETPAPAGTALTTSQKMALVKVLLHCNTMANRQSRDTVVEDLPEAVSQSIRRSDQARTDVSAIVTAALHYPDGLASLIELVRFFEEDSFGMRAVDEVLVGLGLASLVPDTAATPAAGIPAQAPQTTTPATPRSGSVTEVKPSPVLRPPTTPIPFDWVEIPAGEFLMGSDPQKDKQAHGDEQPQHRLTLPTFWITRVPVTVAQFNAFVEATRHTTQAEEAGFGLVWSGSKWEQVKGVSWRAPHGPDSNVEHKQNHPITQVSWRDAQAFCRWAGVQLPSEAEWEKAARGVDGRIYPWGDSPPDKDRCNFGRNVGDTTPAGQYPAGASPYGLLDMSGNVWEWTRSLSRDGQKTFAYPYDASDGREKPDTGPDVSRVLRGGSWSDSAGGVRCAWRLHNDPGNWGYSLGFRLVAPGL